MTDRATKTELVSVLEISAGDKLIDRSGNAWPVTAAGHRDGRYEIETETDVEWITKAYPVDAVVKVLRPGQFGTGRIA
ncbi:hypothetical protein ACWDKQ_34550 [Saccharopolyspora sp. NPDC000995]